MAAVLGFWQGRRTGSCTRRAPFRGCCEAILIVHQVDYACRTWQQGVVACGVAVGASAKRRQEGTVLHMLQDPGGFDSLFCVI